MSDKKNKVKDSVEELIDAFWETVPPLWHIVHAHTNKVAAEHFGITADQFHILRRIHMGHCTVSELADAKRISKAATSRAVDLLVNKGLISRHTDADDRRRVQLELTDEGEELLGKLFQRSRTWMVEQLIQMDEERINAIIQGLTAMKQAFDIPDLPHPKPLVRKK